ncbi:hypothetical protein Dfer_4945 [Dyadobacter fermentans DSM 18053]|uniref:Uncharacterized protein n=1 Tax=Dyadobacter fermentans (strain ATCC 700827 / DSM 18053 / CIP 107007 / KCTC 52180 / NS114) TaxID=471854 RepID=C6W6T4_DYAFD|nr:hypothetical protein Dfer_4945 [Dyadobacter fermentans DSM 18053]
MYNYGYNFSAITGSVNDALSNGFIFTHSIIRKQPVFKKMLFPNVRDE